jgi:2-haloacid dehalogenase
LPARPDVVLFDIFETVLQLEPLRARLVEVGRPGHELELFFTRLLRDGMALTAAGPAPPFGEVASAALRTVSGNTLSRAEVEHVLAGFAELPAHPDVAPALGALADAEVPAWAFTHGSAQVARRALERAGVLGQLRGVLSAEELHAFKPPPRVYHWACEQAGTPPERTALVAVHSWDTHGAMRAGLLAGYATRLDGELPAVFDRPTVMADTLDGVVAGLLALPSS